MAGELEDDLFSIDLYGWGPRICSVFHRPVWLGSSNGELEYGVFSIDMHGWGDNICLVFHRPV
jgi:hypothetical protein